MANSWTLCDTHCHIHDDDYPLLADEVLRSATDSAVRRILTMGSDLTSSQQAINYVRKYDGQYGATVRVGVGVYPQNTANLTHQTIAELQNLIDGNRSLVAAIGEIGLDYYYDTGLLYKEEMLPLHVTRTAGTWDPQIYNPGTYRSKIRLQIIAN